MPFFVELPADKQGNRAFTNSFPCVVEANIIDGPRPELEFIAPPEIANNWKRIYKDQYGGWLEVPGPARPLTWDEREELIAKHRMQRKQGDDVDGQFSVFPAMGHWEIDGKPVSSIDAQYGTHPRAVWKHTT